METAPRRTVLWAGLLGGLGLVFLTPPFEVPDEPMHLSRTYLYAAGSPPAPAADGTPGLALPASFDQLYAVTIGDGPLHPGHRAAPGSVARALRLPLTPGKLVAVPLHTLICYTPVPYLPGIAAAAVGAGLELQPLVILYLGRLLTLSAALALVYLAVAMAPFYRWLFVLFSLLPMALFLRSSVSADALTFAYALLLVSSILAAAWGPPSGVRRALLLVLVLSFAVAAAKGYFALPFLAFLIPGERLGSRGRRAAFRAAVVLLTAAGFAWTLWASSRGAAFAPQGEISAARQLAGIVHHPLAFAALVVRDYGRHLITYSVGFVGNLGWLDTPLHPAVLVACAALLLILAVGEGDPAIALLPRQRLLVALVVAGTLGAVSASQYLSATPVGADFILGLQGRYYLPLAPAGALLFFNRRHRLPLAAPGARRALVAASAAFVGITLLAVARRYHGG